jgi:hypothetical protein
VEFVAVIAIVAIPLGSDDEASQLTTRTEELLSDSTDEAEPSSDTTTRGFTTRVGLVTLSMTSAEAFAMSNAQLVAAEKFSSSAASVKVEADTASDDPPTIRSVPILAAEAAMLMAATPPPLLLLHPITLTVDPPETTTTAPTVPAMLITT